MENNKNNLNASNDMSVNNSKVKQKSNAGMIITIIALSVLSLLLLAGGMVMYMQNNNHRQRAISLQESSYYSLVEAVSNIELNLSKLMVSNSAVYNSNLASLIYSDSNIAQLSLGVLPCVMGDGINTEEFFSGVGDMALAYSSLGLTGGYTQGYSEILKDYYEKAVKVNNAIVEDYDSIKHKISMGYSCSDYMDKNLPYVDDNTTKEKTDFTKDINGRDYFEDKNYDKATLKQAKTLVSKTFEVKEEDIMLVEKTSSSPMVYEFCYMNGKVNDYVTVSVNGGKIISYSSENSFDKANISKNDAHKKAEEYAKNLGYNVKVVYSEINGSVCYATMCPINDGVIDYTHKVKLKVSLSGGELMGIDARDYCLAKDSKTFKGEFSLEQAKQKLKNSLMVTDSNKCIIPLKNDKACMCYEFICYSESDEFIIYVDANKCEIVQVLKVSNLQDNKVRR